MLPPQNYVAWKACMTALHTVAIGASVLRIRIRWKDAKLWWDDYAAGVATLLDVGFAIVFWFMFGTHRGAESSMRLEFTKFSWLNIVVYYSIFWISRVSLALSIARVFPPGTSARKSHIAMAALFFGFCVFSCLLHCALCIWSPSIYPPDMVLPVEEFKNCQPATLRYLVTGGLTAAVDFLSDILAIVVPLTFLWRITLPLCERRLVHGAISATILSAFSGVVTCVFWYAPIDLGQDFRIITAGLLHQQAAMSLIICNLLVVVTYWWRQVYRKTQPNPRRYRHNDPNIPTSKTSAQSPPSASGSQHANTGDGADPSSDSRRSSNLEGSSRLPDDLTFTPITPLSLVSESNPVWAGSSHAAKADIPTAYRQ